MPYFDFLFYAQQKSKRKIFTLPTDRDQQKKNRVDEARLHAYTHIHGMKIAKSRKKEERTKSECYISNEREKTKMQEAKEEQTNEQTVITRQSNNNNKTQAKLYTARRMQVPLHACNCIIWGLALVLETAHAEANRFFFSMIPKIFMLLQYQFGLFK